MIKKIFFLLIYIYIIDAYNLNEYSDITCESNNIIIEAIGTTNGLTSSVDSFTWYGLLLWKKSIPNGICLGGNTDSYGSCSGTMHKICLKLIEISDGSDDIVSYKKKIDEYVNEVSNRMTDQPHFIISPGSTELTEYCIYYIIWIVYYASAFYDGNRHVNGFNTFIIGNSNNIDTVEYNFDFMLSPLIKYTNLGYSVLPLLTQRYSI